MGRMLSSAAEVALFFFVYFRLSALAGSLGDFMDESASSGVDTCL